MEKSIKGTRTEQNLLKAFAGESQARSRYVFFASKAKKEGYEQIAGVFAETAEQEKEHAERFFKFLEGGDVEITASYPTGPIGTTAENLLAAAHGEKEEWDVLYREFAKVAEEEGFIEIATAFKMISTVEAEHERRQDLVAVPQLRFRHRSRRGSQALPRLQASAGLLRAEERELLTEFASWRPCIGTVQGRLFLRRRESLPGSRLSLGREGARFPALICRFVSEDCGIFIIFAG